MTSRDYDYLTLRNLQCYDATDGSYVPTGYVLTAGVRGQGIWTNGVGPFGPTGGTGPSGDTGDVGPAGDSPMGDTGTSGPVGVAGATGTVGLLGPIAEGVTTVGPGPVQSIFVPDTSITSNSMIVVFPLNWDHVLTNIQVSLNPGTGFTIDVSPAITVFDTPGVYTVAVSSAAPVSFQMIGAGGSGSSGGSGGTAGYIQGTITLSPGTTQVKVVVGGVGGGGGGPPSDASYITIPGTGPLFAIAGAGGASDGFLNVAGWGGGGTFTSNVAPGGNANTFSGNGGGGGSVLSVTQGGLAGSECPPNIGAGNPGGNAGSSGLYEQALGGSTPLAGITPGGSGYAGGGSGCAGGGGSSYVNGVTTTIATSFAGNAVPGGTLPGYGRSNQGGYVSLVSSWPAIDVRWWVLRY